MKNIKEIELADILNDLPKIALLDCEKQFQDREFDVFFCALGFEERCLFIPEKLAEIKNFKCTESICFEYSTNAEDNEVNKPKLIRAFQKYTTSWNFLQCDGENFTKNLREFLCKVTKLNKDPKIIFDISVFSSKLLISTIKVLLEFDICLQVVYSEAAIYHPTCNEFEKEPKNWTTEEGFGIARGVSNVVPSSEYPGITRENPDLIVAFATFKPERTKTIITYIDETLLIQPGKRIVWIVGDPHMDEETKKKRKNMLREINKILIEAPSYEVCTLNYKKTLEILDQIYKNNHLEYYISILALGSKMQSLGVALFCYIRPDIPVYHAIPKEYNAKQYSEGCKATWQIDFGNLTDIKCILDKVGKLEVIN